MTERPHIKPPLHGERRMKQARRNLHRAFRRLARSAPAPETRFIVLCGTHDEHLHSWEDA